MGRPGPSAHRAERVVIYQLVVRLFGNTNETQTTDGTITENGCGRFADIDERALSSIRGLGVNHVWLTGVLRQATLTDYAELGLPADHPDVVKGRAGSFYAIRDYYDVCPDYAIDPAHRLAELDALIARIHAAGMRVLLDLVPNHVARGYRSVVRPETDFGLGDDQTRFFSPGNDFFYLADPPGQSLRLSKPEGWSPEGVRFDGRFDRESGGPGRVPRATGNNVTSPHPTTGDWYETVKLNYGYDFVSGAKVFDPMPKVWGKIDEILAYWQARGIDGFRCDFAHYVPKEAWSYLIARAKQRDPSALVIAEAYESHADLLESGFDALYDFETYNALKRIYLGHASAGDLLARLGSIGARARSQYISYVENHDERRLASPLVTGASVGETGFGSSNAMRQLGPIVYLQGNGPILVHNGQEVGEPADGAQGFSGDDGRTSIFDYGSMPELAKWVNRHRYDGGQLSADQKALRQYHAELLALAQDSAVRGAEFVALDGTDGDPPTERSPDLLAFARLDAGSERLLLVAASFAVGGPASGNLRISASLGAKAGLSDGTEYEVRVVFSERGRDDRLVCMRSGAELRTRGFEITVPNQSAHVLVVTRSTRPLG